MVRDKPLANGTAHYVHWELILWHLGAPFMVDERDIIITVPNGVMVLQTWLSIQSMIPFGHNLSASDDGYD